VKPPRILRWASRAVVLVWIVSLLAVSARLQRSEPETEALELARVSVSQPAPTSPAESPDPASRVDSQPPSQSPASEAANAPPPPRPLIGDAPSGEAWLAGERPFPVLSAGYEAFRSFDSYARAMRELGARFVVVRGREIVGRADLDTGQLTRPGSLAGFSPRARNYAGESSMARVESAARKRFGGDSAIRMLVPRGLDAALFGGIARALEDLGDSPAHYSELKGRYEPAPDGSAWLRVESGTRRDGREVSLDLLFHLGQLARGASA